MDNLDPIEQKALELAGHSNGFVSNAGPFLSWAAKPPSSAVIGCDTKDRRIVATEAHRSATRAICVHNLGGRRYAPD
jgi:hypothetical protein